MGRLDASSRRAITEAGARGLLLVAIVAALWIVGFRSLLEVNHNLSLAFNAGAFGAILIAFARGSRAGRGSLNAWDEALAFNAAALLAGALQ